MIAKVGWWTEDNCRQQAAGRGITLPCVTWMGTLSGIWMSSPSWGLLHRCHEQFLSTSWTSTQCFIICYDWWLGFQKGCIFYLDVFAVSVSCICPCLFVYSVCCAWHLLCFLPFCEPVPLGHLGVCSHVIGGLDNPPFWALWLILLRLRKLLSLAKLGEWKNQPTQGDKTAALGRESFRGLMIEEDKEFKAHGWQMVEVWLEIGLSRNILS